jgi:hypothetical protein
VLAIDIQSGLTRAWDAIATFVPKLVGFLIIVLIGYLVAKAISKLVDRLLERVGFDRWVERGALKSGLERAHMDASDILGILAFWTVFLLALQLALGVWGPNAVSDLLRGLIAYLPKVFVAVVILVVAAALAKVATDVLAAMLGGAPAGAWIARAAGAAILIFGIFAALSQLQIAPAIVNGLFYAILIAVAGAFIVAVGGGGIRTMQRYWDRAADSVETTGRAVKASAQAKGEAPTEPIQTVTLPESEVAEASRPDRPV